MVKIIAYEGPVFVSTRNRFKSHIVLRQTAVPQGATVHENAHDLVEGVVPFQEAEDRRIACPEL